MSVGNVGRQSWTPEADYVLESAVLGPETSTQITTLSTDPVWAGSGSDGVFEDFILQCYGQAGNFPFPQLNFPLAKGTKIYLYCTGGGGTATLLLESASAENTPI